MRIDSSLADNRSQMLPKECTTSSTGAVKKSGGKRTKQIEAMLALKHYIAIFKETATIDLFFNHLGKIIFGDFAEVELSFGLGDPAAP